MQVEHGEYRSKEEFKPPDRCVLLQLVQLRGEQTWRNRSVFPIRLKLKIIRVPMLLPCQPAVYSAGFPERRRWRDPLWMSSGRLSLQHQQLLCEKKNDDAVLLTGLHWRRKRKNRVEWVSAAEGVKFAATMNGIYRKDPESWQKREIGGT